MNSLAMLEAMLGHEGGATDLVKQIAVGLLAFLLYSATVTCFGLVAMTDRGAGAGLGIIGGLLSLGGAIWLTSLFFTWGG